MYNLFPVLLYLPDSHRFTVLHLSYFSNESFVEWEGNATLDGKLTHILKGHNDEFNVSQVLPLEHPHIWEQREDNLQQYLKMFQSVVILYTRERKVPCEYWNNACSKRVLTIRLVITAISLLSKTVLFKSIKHGYGPWKCFIQLTLIGFSQHQLFSCTISLQSDAPAAQVNC